MSNNVLQLFYRLPVYILIFYDNNEIQYDPCLHREPYNYNKCNDDGPFIFSHSHSFYPVSEF